MASARIQRWSLILCGYDYSIQHKSGITNADTDALSRLPLPDSPTAVPLPGETVLLLQCLQQTPVTASRIKVWTDKDPLLLQVRNFVLNGWPNSAVDKDLQPYFNRRTEITLLDGCRIWGSRIIVPVAGRSLIMDELHEKHPGVSRLKSLARSFVWWPNIDSDFEAKVQSCTQCQQYQRPHQKLLFIPGNGRSAPGHGYILTLLDPVLERSTF